MRMRSSADHPFGRLISRTTANEPYEFKIWTVFIRIYAINKQKKAQIIEKQIKLR